LVREGLEVSLVDSGEECLRVVSTLNPDLIVLDVMMPGLSGFEVCKKLKAAEATCDIPVVFVTALDSRKDILRGYEAGGIDFIPKPIDHSVLLARVRALLRIQGLVRDKENLLKVNKVLLGRLQHMFEEVSLHTKLSTMKKNVGEASEHIYSQLEMLRSKINEKDALSFLNEIEMSLQFGDILSQQINEIAKISHKLHHLIQGSEDQEVPGAQESSNSVLMAKADQGKIEHLIESLRH